MSERAQTYATHWRYIPQFHFFVLPVVVATIVVTIVEFVRARLERLLPVDLRAHRLRM